MSLTPAEKAWLAEHPTVSLGFSEDLEPYLIQQEDGRLSGFYPTLYKEIEALLGIQFEIVVDDWASVVEQARSRELDGLLACSGTQAETSQLLSVNSIHSFAPALFSSRPDIEINSLSDIHGKRIIYEKDALLISEILDEHKEYISIMEAESAHDAMRKVLEGHADLYFGYSFNSFQISKYSFLGINMVYMDVEHTSHAATAIRDDWPELRNLINKCLDQIGAGKVQQMLDQWAFYKPEKPTTRFSSDEQQWIEDHPSIKIVIDKDGSPYSYMNKRGEFVGILADVISRLESMTGIDVSVEPRQYGEIVEHIKAGDRAVITGFDPPDYPEYRNTYLKSQDITFFPFSLFALKDRSPDAFSPRNIQNKRIAVIQGWDPSHPALQALGDCEIVYAEDELDCINMVLQGRVDALFEVAPLITFLINHNMISQLSLVRVSSHGQPIAFMTHKDAAPLDSIIDKVLSSYTSEDRTELLKKWEVNLKDPHYRLLATKLTEAERQWLVEHDEIKFGIDPDWNPIEWENPSEEPVGLSSDYLALLSDFLNIRFTYIPSKTWAETLDNIKRRKIDMVPCAAILEERKGFMKYTPSYLNLEVKIYVKENANYIRSLSELNGKRLAVTANHAIVDLLRRDYPEIIIVEADTLTDVVKALDTHAVDAIAGDMLTTGHAINALGIHSLKIGGDTPYTYNLAAGIRSDDAVLASIISKALNLITFDSRETIYARWAPLAPPPPDYSIFWKIGIPLLLLLLAATSWSALLKREVTRRTADLKTEQLRLQEAEAIAELGHWEHNLETGEMFWSEEIFRILDQSPQTKPSLEQFYRLVHPDDLEKIKTAREKSIRHGTAIQEDIRLDLNGRSKHIHFQCRKTYRTRKKTAFLVGILQDISERVRIEESLYQSEKMQALGQLAGGVAHDFNNMLAGISGAAELLGLQLPDDPELHEVQGMILKSTRRAAGLTQKLLSFSRKQPITPEQIDFHHLINESAALLTSSIDPRIKMELNLSADKTDVIGDASQLQNVLLNLGINAAQAMPDGGTLCINTASVSLDPDFCQSSNFEIFAGEYLEIEMVDTGCGMSHETMKRIFEPFFTTKERGKGTGLGLATVLGTIQQHGGSINVHSKVGEGSCFHIFLPLNTTLPTNEAEEDTKLIHGQGTILLVDDDDILRITTKATLEDLGYEVLVAENGKIGVETYRQHQQTIDLVLLDMIMPVMNGHDCFKTIKAINKDACVLLSSGYAQKEDVDEMLKGGLCGIIQKPYLSTTLSQALHNALTHSGTKAG